MKLGKILDLNKCFYDETKKSWSHPDLKDDHEYVVEFDDEICTGRFSKMQELNSNGKPNGKEGWAFFKSDRDTGEVEFGDRKDRHPTKDGWVRIQEVIT